MKNHFAFEIIPGSDKIEELFGVLDHPVTFVVDQRGTITFDSVGGNTGDKARTEAYGKIKPVIDGLLKQE